MTQQDFNLSILEMDNQLNQRCEPIRKEIDRVGAELDDARTQKNLLSLRLDTAKREWTDANYAMTATRAKYADLRSELKGRRASDEISQRDFDDAMIACNTNIEKETAEIKAHLGEAFKKVADMREQYGLMKVHISELIARMHDLQARLKTIQREEWNRKHDFIVRNPKDSLEA